MMKNLIAILSLLFLMSACTSKSPTDADWRPDMAHADFGPYPTDYVKIVKKWGDKNFDKVARLNYVAITAPKHEYLVTDSEKKEAIYGYSVCADVSGIRYDGAYKPVQKHWFFIRDGKVIDQRSLEDKYNRVIYRDHQISCD